MSTSQKPNVVLIVNHDLSRDWFGCQGAPIHTPNLDRFAQSGYVFDRHYCQYPMCGPSRANLYTGCRPDTTQLFRNVEFYPHFRERVGEGSATMPEHFRGHGYWTQSIGNVMGETLGKTDDDTRLPAYDSPSWSAPHWGPEHGELPSWMPAANRTASNLAHYVTDTSREMIRRRIHALRMQGKDPEMNSKRCGGPCVEMADVPDNAYPTGKITDGIVNFLKEYSSRPDQPFFLTAGYSTGHFPWVAPKRFWDLYDPGNLVLPKTSQYPSGSPEYAPFRNAAPAKGYTQDAYDKAWAPTLEQLLELRHGYFACVSYFDAEMGKIIKALDDLGLQENTIVVITTDHGLSMGEHGHWHKVTNYEPDHGVPLFLSAPGCSADKHHIEAFTEHVDIYPTLCDLCDLPTPGHLEGTSFAPLLKNPDQPWKQAAFGQVRRVNRKTGKGVMGYTLRTDRYRYTRWVDLEDDKDVKACELYDYKTDPLETVNCINDTVHAKVLKELEAMMDAGWRGALPPETN